MHHNKGLVHDKIFTIGVCTGHSVADACDQSLVESKGHGGLRLEQARLKS